MCCVVIFSPYHSMVKECSSSLHSGLTQEGITDGRERRERREEGRGYMCNGSSTMDRDRVHISNSNLYMVDK